jgi:16S rRNA (guanine1516-N2)-methyltransferase
VISATPDDTTSQKAKDLAGQLKVPLVPASQCVNYDAHLVYTENGLQIQLKHDSNKRTASTLYVDFLSKSLRYRLQHGGGIKQALARAVGLKPGVRPSVMDATAGLGIDSFILASLGCSVTMVERSPLMAAMLVDGWDRALRSQDIPEEVKERLTLLHGNSLLIIQGLAPQERPDTIYLDPMYPHMGKTALNKIEMRLIRMMVGDDTDSDTLLQSALQCAKKRVVVKRPKGAIRLSSKEPSHIITMKNSRYDVYML